MNWFFVLVIYAIGGYIIGTYDGWWDVLGVALVLWANNKEQSYNTNQRIILAIKTLAENIYAD